MTEQHLQEWIKHPEHLNEESLQELKELVGRYPYFQTARVLYLKNLFVLKDPSFQEELRRSAIYIADLSLLFYFIEGERFTIRKHAPQETRSGQGESDRTLDLIDRFLAELPEEPAQELPLPAEVSVDYTSILLDRMTEGDEEVAAVPLGGEQHRYYQRCGPVHRCQSQCAGFKSRSGACDCRTWRRGHYCCGRYLLH